MRLHLRASNIARRAIAAIGATAVAFAMLGTGALAAAPVVHDVMQAYFQLKKDREKGKYAQDRSPAHRAF